MPEHQIRLRAAWRWRCPTDPPEVFRQVNLPTFWPPGLESPIRLVRKFGRPPIDPRSEALRLELHDVPGLVSAWLNGLEIVRARSDLAHWDVELSEPLSARNELVLEVDLRSADQPDRRTPWGVIALVIVSKEGAF